MRLKNRKREKTSQYWERRGNVAFSLVLERNNESQTHHDRIVKVWKKREAILELYIWWESIPRAKTKRIEKQKLRGYVSQSSTLKEIAKGEFQTNQNDPIRNITPGNEEQRKKYCMRNQKRVWDRELWASVTLRTHQQLKCMSHPKG